MGSSTRVGLRISPGASRTEIVGRHGEVWKVRIAAPAERGRANDALLELLARTLDVPRRRLALVAGAGARDKIVEIEGMPRDDVERRLGGVRRTGA